jgi:hypothetical protein
MKMGCDADTNRGANNKVCSGTCSKTRETLADREDREKRLFSLLNNILSVVDAKASDINHVVFKAKSEEQQDILNYFAENSDMILDGTGQVRVFGLIATITEILYGKRLAWCVNDKGYVTGVTWYNQPKVACDASGETPSS